jgi:hypothetical protein
MDPAVIAALITTPTAVIAATAAYAAGRAQARGAHRGPVDAVRRQHQRDAYAELTRAAWSYVSSTGNVMLQVQQLHGARLSRHELTPDARGQLGRSLTRSGFRRGDLADALAPADIPPAVDRALAWLEQVSPTWQQDIHDANQFDDLGRAVVVVTLEGPDHLAELAEQLRRQALSVQHCWANVALRPFLPPLQRETEQEVPPQDLLGRLKEATQDFTRAARAHLNTH